MYVAEARSAEKYDEGERIRKKRNVWVYDWLQKRSTHGTNQTIAQEYRDVVNQKFLIEKLLRMGENIFDELLQLVTPLIRTAIPPAERLAITLRYLALDNSYASISALFRIQFH